MNDPFTMYNQHGTFQTTHHRDYRDLATYNSENNNTHQTHLLCDHKSDESEKLTSAALRSPVIAPIDKRVGGFAAYSVNERVGKPPQPTPLGYEQRNYPFRRNSNYCYNDTSYSSDAAYQRRQTSIRTIMQHSSDQAQPPNKLMIYQPLQPQQGQQKNITGSSSNALVVQQQWPALWQGGGSNHHQKQRTNSLEHQQQQQHHNLFSIPPTSTTTTKVQKSGDMFDFCARTATHHHQHYDPFISTPISASACDNGDNSSCPPTWSQIISSSSSSTTAANNVTSPTSVSQPNMTPLKNEESNFKNTRDVSPTGFPSTTPSEINNSQGEDENDSLPRPRANNATKLLSQSLSYTMAVANNPPAHPKRYAVAKISNIPWNASIHDIEMLFKEPELGVKLPNKQDTAQCIHIIIDKSSGKTLSEAYVEFETEKDINKVLQKLKSPQVKTRRVYITKSSPESLFKDIFPQWRGIFIDGLPSVVNEQQQQTVNHISLDSIYPSPTPPPPLVEGHEYESLLSICRNFKLHFSRKCAERPFENFISMIVKFPWNKPAIITTMQRDHLYEYYKLATGVLHAHLGKPNIQIDKTLMPRMVRAAIMCPGLTIPQKKGILAASEIPCPVDLLHLIEPPSDDEITSTSSGDEQHMSNLFSKITISEDAK